MTAARPNGRDQEAQKVGFRLAADAQTPADESAAGTAAPVSVGFRLPPADEDAGAAKTEGELKTSFEQADFLRLLCLVYGVNKIEDEELRKALENYKADPAYPAPKEYGDVLHTVAPSGHKVMVRFDSVLTNKSPREKLTAEEIYEMAVLAKANPAMAKDGVEIVAQSDEERALFFLAAREVGLVVKNPPEDIAPETFASAKRAFDALMKREPETAPTPQRKGKEEMQQPSHGSPFNFAPTIWAM